MRYEIQWFPDNEDKYNVHKLEKAVSKIPVTKDIKIVPYYNRYYTPQTVSQKKPEAVQFTMPTVSHEETNLILDQVKSYLSSSIKSKGPQWVTIRAISTAERKKVTKKTQVKRKAKCGCKK